MMRELVFGILSDPAPVSQVVSKIVLDNVSRFEERMMQLFFVGDEYKDLHDVNMKDYLFQSSKRFARYMFLTESPKIHRHDRKFSSANRFTHCPVRTSLHATMLSKWYDCNRNDGKMMKALVFDHFGKYIMFEKTSEVLDLIQSGLCRSSFHNPWCRWCLKPSRQGIQKPYDRGCYVRGVRI